MALEYTIELTRAANRTVKVRANSMKEAEEKAIAMASNSPGGLNNWFVSKVRARKIEGESKSSSVLEALNYDINKRELKNTKNEGECRGRDRADVVFDSTCLHCTSLSDNVNPSTPCLCQGDVE